MKNICKFKICLSKENNTSKYITQIQNAYLKTIVYQGDYIEYIKNEFENQKETFKAVFNEKDLIAYKNVKGIDYYIFIKDNNQNLDQCSAEIVFVAKDKNLSRCIDLVFTNIKEILQKENIKIEYQLSELYLYLTDKNSEDIIFPQITINASLEKHHSFEKGEIAGHFIYFLISIILFFIGIFNKNDETVLWSSVFCSLGFLIPNVISIVIKAIPTNKVVIKDFAQWIDQNNEKGQIFNDTEDLSSPDLPNSQNQ